MDPNTVKVLSLCAGAGGLDLGIRLAVPTARTVCFVEIEAYACEILATRMEEQALDEAPIWTDLRTFDGTAWRGRVDLLAAGYPCQPFSVAGRKRGADDPRHLWPEVERIIKECRPPVVFFENVPHHLSIGGREVAEALVGLGYRVAITLLEAAEVGASHRRQRLFILGVDHAPSPRCRRQLESGEQTGHRRAGSPGTGTELADPRVSSPARFTVQRGQGREASARTGGSGVQLADAGHERHERDPRAGREAVDGPEHASGTLAESLGAGTRSLTGEHGGAGRESALLQAQRQARASGAESAGADLADTDGGGCAAGTATELSRPDESQSRICGGELADTEHAGRQLHGSRNDDDGDHARGRDADRRYAGLPAFPPRRDNVDAWRGILERWPELAPALVVADADRGGRAPQQHAGCRCAATGGGQADAESGCRGGGCACAQAEPPVRRMVDGLADRVDRLRLCGNGVVPAQAAFAFRETWTALMESDA